LLIRGRAWLFLAAAALCAEACRPANDEDSCPLPLAEDGWCAAPEECLLYISIGTSPCCMLDSTGCCPELNVSFLGNATETFTCAMTALRDGAPARVGIAVDYCTFHFMENRIVVLGNGEAEVTRSVTPPQGAPALDTARVQVKDAAFFEACLAPGMPEVDPCLAVHCATSWFDEASCDDEVCCVPSMASGEELLCPSLVRESLTPSDSSTARSPIRQ